MLLRLDCKLSDGFDSIGHRWCRKLEHCSHGTLLVFDTAFETERNWSVRTDD